MRVRLALSPDSFSPKGREMHIVGEYEAQAGEFRGQFAAAWPGSLLGSGAGLGFSSGFGHLATGRLG